MEQSKSKSIDQKKNDRKITDEFPVSFSIFALARSHRALAGQMLREIGLYPGQEILLMQLWNQDSQSQNSLRKTLGLDHSTIAKTVQRMEKADLVKRSRSPEDGRVTVVSLTKAGQDLNKKVLEIWSSLEHITTNNMSKEETDLFVSLTQKIASNVEKSID